MYSNLTLYYLNQLGITPWVTKKSYLSLVNETQTVNQIAPKLVIFKQKNLTDKAEILLSRMIKYLNLNDSDILVSESMESYSRLEKHLPMAILSFGLNTSELPSVVDSSCPVLSSLSPDYVLNNPSKKSEIFKVLNSIKALIIDENKGIYIN